MNLKGWKQSRLILLLYSLQFFLELLTLKLVEIEHEVALSFLFANLILLPRIVDYCLSVFR